MEAKSPLADGSQYLTFFIGGEEYAIRILKVREVIEYDTLTRVPGVPACVRGVMNLRGTVVPVVDLAVKFGLPPCEITRRTCVVVVEVQPQGGGDVTAMGVMADAVSQVVTLTAEDVEPPPDFGTRVRLDLLLGMGRMGKKFAMLLDSDRLLATEELLAAAVAAPGPASGRDAAAGTSRPAVAKEGAG